jgi:hypothetical protein
VLRPAQVTWTTSYDPEQSHPQIYEGRHVIDRSLSIMGGAFAKSGGPVARAGAAPAAVVTRRPVVNWRGMPSTLVQNSEMSPAFTEARNEMIRDVHMTHEQYVCYLYRNVIRMVWSTPRWEGFGTMTKNPESNGLLLEIRNHFERFRYEDKDSGCACHVPPPPRAPPRDSSARARPPRDPAAPQACAAVDARV